MDSSFHLPFWKYDSIISWLLWLPLEHFISVCVVPLHIPSNILNSCFCGGPQTSALISSMFIKGINHKLLWLKLYHFFDFGCFFHTQGFHTLDLKLWLSIQILSSSEFINLSIKQSPLPVQSAILTWHSQWSHCRHSP